MTNIPIEEIKNAIEAYKKERRDTMRWEYFMGRPEAGGKLNHSLSDKQQAEINTLLEWVEDGEDLNKLPQKVETN